MTERSCDAEDPWDPWAEIERQRGLRCVIRPFDPMPDREHQRKQIIERKQHARDYYRRWLAMMGPKQEPQAEEKVTKRSMITPDLPTSVKCPDCDWWANWAADFGKVRRYKCPECNLRFELRYLPEVTKV